MKSLITFGIEHLTFKSEKLLKSDFNVELIPIPIYIELDYFDGIAPCGFGLLIEESDSKKISELLLSKCIEIKHKFMIEE